MNKKEIGKKDKEIRESAMKENKEKELSHTSLRRICSKCGIPFCPDCWKECPTCEPETPLKCPRHTVCNDKNCYARKMHDKLPCICNTETPQVIKANPDKVSKCCNAGVRISEADEGTCCFVCEKCDLACDLVEETPQEGGICDKCGAWSKDISNTKLGQDIKNMLDNPPQDTVSNWEERYDTMVQHHHSYKDKNCTQEVINCASLKSFIKNLLSKQKEEIITKMKIIRATKKEGSAEDLFLEDLIKLIRYN